VTGANRRGWWLRPLRRSAFELPHRSGGVGHPVRRPSYADRHGCSHRSSTLRLTFDSGCRQAAPNDMIYGVVFRRFR
jgi:hypothetical protein